MFFFGGHFFISEATFTFTLYTCPLHGGSGFFLLLKVFEDGIDQLLLARKIF